MSQGPAQSFDTPLTFTDQSDVMVELAERLECGQRTVNVLAGESLADVAFRVNVSFGLLAAINELSGPWEGKTRSGHPRRR